MTTWLLHSSRAHEYNGKQKCHTVGTVPKYNRKSKKDATWTPRNTQIYDRSLYWFGAVTLIISGGVKQGIWTHTSPLSEMMWSPKRFSHVSKMQTFAYKRTNYVAIKNTIILNIMRNIFNRSDTYVVYA